MKIKKDSNI